VTTAVPARATFGDVFAVREFRALWLSAFGAYQIAVNTAFVIRVPDERRAQAFGIAGMGVIVGQGAGFVAIGTAAELVTPAVVIAVAGGIGAVAAFALTLSWRRVSPSG